MIENPSVSYEELGNRLNLSKTAIYNKVVNLKNIGILERKGRKIGEWIVKI